MTTPLNLSDIIIRHKEVQNFKDLLILIGQVGKEGGVLLSMDIKPDFPDTPRDWELKVETAFSWGG